MWAPASRLLLQQDAATLNGAEPAPPSTLDLRITAIFVILLSGFLGGLLPLVVKVRARRRDRDKHAAVCMRRELQQTITEASTTP